jgi:hypothetical protein
MKYRYSLGGSLVMALLVGSVLAADGPQSGPQVGQSIPGPFHPLNVTGPGAGRKLCQI